MHAFRNLSIRTKLMSSMLACLLLFVAISTTLGFVLTGASLRERVVGQELPAVVGEIRNDILRQIGTPLAMARSVAGNSFVLDWEAAGEPEDGNAAWARYAQAVKQQAGASSVFWVSGTTGQYFGEQGPVRKLAPKGQGDQWFYELLAGDKSQVLEIDKDVSSNAYMLFINVRFDAGQGRQGIAGLGLSVDELAQAVRAYQVGESGSVSLVRGNGSILVHRDPALVDGKHWLKDRPGFSAGLSAALLNRERFAHAMYEAPSGRQLIASSYVPELDLYVIAELPEAQVLGGVRRTIALTSAVAGLVGGGIGLLVIWLVSRAIAAPVGRAARMLEEIADGHGDLSRRMPVESNDEVGALASAFNRFVSSLERMVGAVRQAADSISVASSEVAQGNQDLSQRTEQAASALQQTAASLSVLTDSVQANTEATRSAGDLAQSARGVAERGGAAFQQVVVTMEGINHSSRKIADIIGVIDSIAFQTNILALNAAVEAARAGEQGRGFSVVAAEVRSLAQRSAEAAKEVRQLITDSVTQVGSGSQQVAHAGATMQELLDAVARVTRIIDEISDASQTQGRGIAEINQSVAGLDDATQQNSALVEQSAAAATSLREQAARLMGEVSAFKLGEIPQRSPSVQERQPQLLEA
ncbi:methyl-accepting chemotaxis protein [Comamonas testosteroni]|uniref:Methyl-accepting chemotaxis protein n=1 Tax=Comamonas testosteroni TaxID=285 RepID=A0A5A7MH70_COMTE|nr:methyl-accepting chemotaxis protein [Comamonas testosteroni]GEQ77022.1 methyl-accepting chemotaxis protein [Comamonas testosteroni]